MYAVNVERQLIQYDWQGHTSHRVTTDTVVSAGHVLRGRQNKTKTWGNLAGLVQVRKNKVHNKINSLAPGGFDYSLKLANFKLISTINVWSIFCEIAIRWMPQPVNDH